MEDLWGREIQTVEMHGLSRNRTCADCKHFAVNLVWDYCNLNERVTNGVICHGYDARPYPKPPADSEF